MPAGFADSGQRTLHPMPLAAFDPSAAIRSLAGHVTALDAAAEVIAEFGLYVVAVIILLAWLRPDGLRACLAAVAAAAAAVGAGGIVGAIWMRPRPFVAGHFAPLIDHSADASFPSDHVAALAAVAAALWFASRWLGAVTWVLAELVGLARVFVGVHYVSDIAGGTVVGFAVGAGAWAATGRLGAPLTVIEAWSIRLHLRPRVDGAAPNVGQTAVGQ